MSTIFKSIRKASEIENQLFKGLTQSSQLEAITKNSKDSFDVLSPSKTNAYQITLDYGQESTEIQILFAHYGDNKVISLERAANRPESVVGFFVEDDKLKQVEVVKEEVILKETPANKDILSFVDLIPVKNEISTQDMDFDGCLAFSDLDTGQYLVYKHCGKNCGDGNKYGGGTPINDLDYCCRAHDRCYSNFGFDDCGCDSQLATCANTATSSTGWYSVWLWAKYKACTHH